MGQVKFVEDSLLKILLGPFLDNLTHLKKQLNTKTCDIEFAKRISQKWKIYTIQTEINSHSSLGIYICLT